jgi:hypothetical protein
VQTSTFSCHLPMLKGRHSTRGIRHRGIRRRHRLGQSPPVQGDDGETSTHTATTSHRRARHFAFRTDKKAPLCMVLTVCAHHMHTHTVSTTHRRAIHTMLYTLATTTALPAPTTHYYSMTSLTHTLSYLERGRNPGAFKKYPATQPHKRHLLKKYPVNT